MPCLYIKYQLKLICIYKSFRHIRNRSFFFYYLLSIHSTHMHEERERKAQNNVSCPNLIFHHQQQQYNNHWKSGAHIFYWKASISLHVCEFNMFVYINKHRALRHTRWVSISSLQLLSSNSIHNQNVTNTLNIILQCTKAILTFYFIFSLHFVLSKYRFSIPLYILQKYYAH